MRDFLAGFERELRSPAPLPERLALAIAALAYPALEMDEALAALDAMAELMGRRLAGVAPGRERANAFMEVFTVELGFAGNREQYHDADNSYLNRVLETRSGLPILLSLVCAAIGRRLAPHFGWTVDGVGFPGHFMARLHDGGGIWLLDPFYGQVVAVDEAADYLSRLFGTPVALPAEVYRPVPPAAWAQRILNNLRSVYLGLENYGMGARVVQFMLAINGANPPLWRELAILHQREDRWDAAIYALRRYFFLRGQYSLLWGTEEARSQLLGMVSQEDRQLYALHQKLQDILVHVN
jgi:regulator of sirC expression with transglutaminase-like and TPR domain